MYNLISSEEFELISNQEPDCTQHRHVASETLICEVCNKELCNHSHFSLRGCTKLKGHEGPHMNGWGHQQTWSDKEGMYINNQKDWNLLLHKFVNPTN